MPPNDEELEDLVRAIELAIAQRGFYLLMDDRLELICGKGCADLSDPRHIEMVSNFATLHGWVASIEAGRCIFRRA